MNIRQVYATILLLGWILFLIPSFAAAADVTGVAVNQSRILSVNGVSRVAIANPDIADVMVVSGSEVLLIGKAPGVTTLHLWTVKGRTTYQVEVASDDIPIANEIKNILKLNELQVSKIGKTIILEGKVDSKYQKDRAEKVAGAYGDKVVNLLEITRPVQVKIETLLLEINREKVNDLGIKWGNGVAGDFSAGGFALGQSYSNSVVGNAFGRLGTYANINAQISALVKNKVAKVLSQPNMITVSGDKANIMVGGQIPIPISNQNGQITIEWKDYGIKLDIEPEVNAEGLINSKVKAEVSSLDWNSTHKLQLTSTLYIPPLKMNKAETAIALSSGQTMAIGGLTSSETSKDVTKVPLLADIPILGKLFTSTSFNRGETELVILVTPTIVNPEEYLPQTSEEMKHFIKENPQGGAKDGGKN